jgi:hypothetical protein
MSKVVWNILDGHFAHEKYSVAGRDAEHVNWDRQLKDLNNPTFYSHMEMFKIDQLKTPKENSYGLIFESRGIDLQTYGSVEALIPKFNKVFIHNSEYLKKYENCKWIPGGGIWVGGRLDTPHAEGEIKIQEKTKLCSMVSSDKQMCRGHLTRLQIMNLVKDNNKIDKFFGIGGPNDNSGWIPIFRSLKDYMFSIVIENYIDDLYITERVLNCFATGTIPIYLGAPNIGSIFNEKGIIQLVNLSSIEEFNNIINNLTSEFYYDRIDAIKENFEKCKQYKSIEDYIYLNYLQNSN